MEDFPDGPDLSGPGDGEPGGSVQDRSHDHPQDEEGRSCRSCEEGRRVLGLLEAYGAWNPAWKAAWDRCLLAAVDGAAGAIAGHRMRTQDTEGCAVASECLVPVPGPGSGFTPAEVFSAFGYAMTAGVRARLQVMRSPGGEG